MSKGKRKTIRTADAAVVAPVVSYRGKITTTITIPLKWREIIRMLLGWKLQERVEILTEHGTGAVHHLPSHAWLVPPRWWRRP